MELMYSDIALLATDGYNSRRTLEPAMNQLLTIGALRAATGISAPTLRRYGDAGLISCTVDSAGRRLFPAEAVDEAKRVRARHAERAGQGIR